MGKASRRKKERKAGVGLPGLICRRCNQPVRHIKTIKPQNGNPAHLVYECGCQRKTIEAKKS